MTANSSIPWFIRMSAALALLIMPPACRGAPPRPVAHDAAASLAALRQALGSAAEQETAGLFPYYMHVLDGFVVLRRQAPEAWSDGPPLTQHSRTEDEKPSDGHSIVSTAYRTVRLAQLPRMWRTLQGTRLFLMNEKGPVCQGSIAELLMLGQVRMNGCPEGGHCEDEANRAGSGYAKLIWDIAETGGVSLGARIAPAPGSGPCSGATWARVAIGPPPRITLAQEAAPAWRRAALTQFGKLLQQPPYQHTLKTAPLALAQADPAQPGGPWDREARIQLFPSALPGASLLSLGFDVGSEELMPEYYQQCIIWAVSGPPESAEFRLLDGVHCRLQSLSLPWLKGAVDVDGDGRLELLTDYGLNRDPLRLKIEYSDGASDGWTSAH